MVSRTRKIIYRTIPALLFIGAIALFFSGYPELMWAFIALLVSLLALVIADQYLKRARLIEDIPTSKIRSAAQGVTELEGKAKLLPGATLYSPLTRTPCLWWRYSIERESSDNKDETIARGTSDTLFVLEDDTGQCLVNPIGAECIPDIKHAWHGNSPKPETGPENAPKAGTYRYSEEILTASEKCYVLGAFTSSPKRLNAGQSKALKLIGLTGADFIEYPQNMHHYVISSNPPKELTRRFRLTAKVAIAVFFVLISISVAIFVTSLT